MPSPGRAVAMTSFFLPPASTTLQTNFTPAALAAVFSFHSTVSTRSCGLKAPTVSRLLPSLSIFTRENDTGMSCPISVVTRVGSTSFTSKVGRATSSPLSSRMTACFPFGHPVSGRKEKKKPQSGRFSSMVNIRVLSGCGFPSSSQVARSHVLIPRSATPWRNTSSSGASAAAGLIFSRLPPSPVWNSVDFSLLGMASFGGATRKGNVPSAFPSKLMSAW